MVKIFKYAIIIISSIAVILGGLSIYNSHFKHLPPVANDSIRIHFYALGQSELEALLYDKEQVESSIPEYKLVNIKMNSFDSDGKKIWVCDATIDIKKSLFQDNEPKHTKSAF